MLGKGSARNLWAQVHYSLKAPMQFLLRFLVPEGPFE